MANTTNATQRPHRAEGPSERECLNVLNYPGQFKVAGMISNQTNYLADLKCTLIT